MRNFGSRVVDLGLCLLAGAVLLSFAWSIIRPLLSVLLAVGLLVVLVPLGIRRFRGY